MADDLEEFYREIASVEKQVQEGGEGSETAKQSTSPTIASRPQIIRGDAVISNRAVISKESEVEEVKTIETQRSEVKESKQQSQTKDAKKPVGIVREAAGKRWVDPNLVEWPENDFRIFVGNLGPEVTDSMLTNAFTRYESFNKATVVQNKLGHKSRGYGFVSMSSIQEGARALKEMQGYYIGNRPCQLKRAATEERTVKDKYGRAKKRPLPGQGHHMGQKSSRTDSMQSNQPKVRLLHK
eukprot:jgi/Picsp_1/1377/NSC_04856-R1_protein